MGFCTIQILTRNKFRYFKQECITGIGCVEDERLLGQKKEGEECGINEYWGKALPPWAGEEAK